MQQTTYTALAKDQQELLDAAEKATYTAYAPYSHYHVGAAIRTTDNTIITASNVENAAWGTICSERAAIITANAQGYRSYTAIAVLARLEGGKTGEPSAPCGVCRQFIMELSQVSGIDTEIIFSTDGKEKVFVTTISELLPSPFGPQQLNVDVSPYKK